MDQETPKGPRVEETLKEWRTAHRALAEATARRERIAAAARLEEHSGSLSAAVLAERSAAAAEREARQRFREARQRVVERVLGLSGHAPGSDARAGAQMTSLTENSTI